MNEKIQNCKAEVRDGWHSYRCSNKAGYGPDKAFCKIHARERGARFGEIVTLYRVMPKNWRGPMRIAEAEAEVTEKMYRLSGNETDFDCARNLSKDACAKQGVFTTKAEALDYFLKQASARVESTAVAATQAEKELELAEIFVKEQGE